MFAISDIMGSIHDTIDGDAYVIFGTTTDSTLDTDEVKITIVATGFQEINTTISEKTDLDIPKPDPQITPYGENYYDTPPSMRGYSIQFTL